MNRITLIGRACRDAELRTTGTGKEVASFTLAVDGRGKDAKATFFRVTCWEKLAQIAGQYVRKGKQLAVVGAVSVSEYDGKDGRRFSLDVSAQELELLGSKNDGESAGNHGGESAGKGGQSQGAGGEAATKTEEAPLPFTDLAYQEVDDDDLPF